MEESCRRAQRAGLGVLAFTEHADYTAIAAGSRLDVLGYMESLARCRRRFPGLTLLSGVELGEPHRFPEEATGLLGSCEFDLVLGSVHCIEAEGSLIDLSLLDGEAGLSADATLTAYLEEVLKLLQGSIEFEVLAHLEYPKRYWPRGWPPYRALDREERVRAVLEMASARGLTLELNTTGGTDPEHGMCPGPEVVGWWREAGGRAVSVGSDAHHPEAVAAGFGLAAAVLEGKGFSASKSRPGFWAAVTISRPSSPSRAEV